MGKGGEFERTCSVLLSKWVSKGERDDLFWRSDSSGARFTQRKKSGKDTANAGGDLTFSDILGEPLIRNWSVEIKTGYGVKTDTGINRWDVLDFVDSKQKEPVLQKMWNQCTRDALLTNRIPVLIFRRNNRTPCIMFDNLYFQYLEGWFGQFVDGVSIRINFPLCCTLLLLSDFFKWIPDISPALRKD